MRRWLDFRVPLTELLGNELVGLEEVQDGWDVRFGPGPVGRLSKEGRFKKVVGERGSNECHPCARKFCYRCASPFSAKGSQAACLESADVRW